MRIILSRKGVDRGAGGFASPILPNNILLSIPIPGILSGKDFIGNNYECNQYKNLLIPTGVREYLFQYKIRNYKDLVYQLLKNENDKTLIKIKEILSKKECFCHLDPDLIYDIKDREDDWMQTFGPSPTIWTAQENLIKHNIKKDDLFLFFGWFRKTEIHNETLNYSETDKNGRHIIFGYLQIGNILKSADYNNKKEEVFREYPWIKGHPHLDRDLWKEEKNTIYIAKPTLKIDCKETEFKGAGWFKNLHEDLILTENNHKRSFWKKSLFPLGSTIYLKEIPIDFNKHWSDGIFRYIGRAQEFIIGYCPNFENHVKRNIFKLL